MMQSLNLLNLCSNSNSKNSQKAPTRDPIVAGADAAAFWASPRGDGAIFVDGDEHEQLQAHEGDKVMDGAHQGKFPNYNILEAQESTTDSNDHELF